MNDEYLEHIKEYNTIDEYLNVRRLPVESIYGVIVENAVFSFAAADDRSRSVLRSVRAELLQAHRRRGKSSRHLMLQWRLNLLTHKHFVSQANLTKTSALFRHTRLIGTPIECIKMELTT